MNRVRAAPKMLYLDAVKLTRHRSWAAFNAACGNARPVLLTTRGSHTKSGFRFASRGILLLRRESSGVPGDVHAQANKRVAVPVAGSMRSPNVAAIALGKAFRQTDGFPAAGVLETVP